MRQRFIASLVLLAACVAEGEDPPPPIDDGELVDTADPVDTDPPADTGPQDQDGDGVPAPTDCNDSDARTFPGAEERCDGRDNDCVDGPAPGEALVDGVPACAPCDAAGWWPVVRDLTDTDDGRTVLTDLVDDLACTYDQARDDLFGPVDGTPAPEGGTQAEGLYTGVVVTYAGAQPEPGIMNTEHTWPQSRGADTVPLRCDLNHLFPADAGVNSRRGSLPFGEVVVANWTDTDGNREGGGLFEPREAAKGRIARALLYVALFYNDRLAPEERPSAYELDIAKDWHALYPPTELEQARAARVYAAQGVANPLVVCDGLDARLGVVD